MERLIKKIERIKRIAIYVEMWHAAMYFVDAVAASMMDNYIRRMRNVMKAEELEKFPAISKGIMRLQDMTQNMQSKLWHDYSKGLRVGTKGWLEHYEKDYISLGRLFPSATMKFAAMHKYDISMMEMHANTVALNQQKNMSQTVVALGILTASWAEMMRVFNERIRKNWTEVAGPQKVADAKNIMFGNMAKAIHKASDNLVRSTCDLKTDDHLWWENYHKSEDELFCKVAKLLQNEQFSNILMEQMTNDWLDYYLGRTVMDAQKDGGKTPRAVKVEVAELAHWGKKPLARDFDIMVKEVSQALPEIDDPWDVVAYLEEHPYKVVERFRSLVMEKIQAPPAQQ